MGSLNIKTLGNNIEKVEKVIKALQERVSVSVDKKTLVITASVKMQDPVICAEVTKVVLDRWQPYIGCWQRCKAF